ncbi:uncharacterized protein H6S33_003681 [Morchella sextelata]|uniref:uncharacterized protein n=1 Tax=Morchella sextelata TaxID=1174677 RepID=UPI001D03E048|nr:uncharacterized protein H6S33_003681 [Morchella sextelata]KAH0606847.1 hypothetical protein H6S33_003681 [Morchella sextelata]
MAAAAAARTPKAAATAPALAQLQLYLSPPPKNISESRAIFREVSRFGEIQMFKALRFEETTKEFKPRAHIIFRSPVSVERLLGSSPLPVPTGTGNTITVTPSATLFNHEQYIQNNSPHFYAPTTWGRNVGPGEDLSTVRDEGMEPDMKARAMRVRMMQRYTGGFVSFAELEERIAMEGVRGAAEGGVGIGFGGREVVGGILESLRREEGSFEEGEDGERGKKRRRGDRT